MGIEKKCLECLFLQARVDAEPAQRVMRFFRFVVSLVLHDAITVTVQRLETEAIVLETVV